MIGRAKTSNLVQNTPEWEEARKGTIGSSTIPILTGNSPHDTSPIAVWAVMTGQLKADPIDPETQDLFDLGHALEDDIADAYTRKTGRRLKRVRKQLHDPDIPWATASLDRVSAMRGERIIVELKWDPWSHGYGRGDDLVPLHVADQVQWQMMVTGYPVAHVAVLSGGRPSWYEVKADRQHQDDLLFIARDFMGYVERRERPPVDGSEATRRTLTRLHPEDTAEMLEPTLALEAMAERLRLARLEARVADEEVGTASNAMRAALGDSAGVEGERYLIRWTKNRDSRRTDHRAVVEELMGMADVADIDAAGLARVIEKHTQTVEGARVLRPYFRDEIGGKWL